MGSREALFRGYWPRPAILRHDQGLAASPPVRYKLRVARSDRPPCPCFLSGVPRVFEGGAQGALRATLRRDSAAIGALWRVSTPLLRPVDKGNDLAFRVAGSISTERNPSVALVTADRALFPGAWGSSVRRVHRGRSVNPSLTLSKTGR